jgi:hypothetical protein
MRSLSNMHAAVDQPLCKHVPAMIFVIPGLGADTTAAWHPSAEAVPADRETPIMAIVSCLFQCLT